MAKRSFRKFVISKDRQIEGIVLDDTPQKLPAGPVILGQQRTIPTVKKQSVEAVAKKEEPPLSDLGVPSFLETLKQMNPYVITPAKDASAFRSESIGEPESFVHTVSSPEAAENAYQLSPGLKMTPVRGVGTSTDGMKVYKQHTESVIKLVQTGTAVPEQPETQPLGTVQVPSARRSVKSPEAPANP